MFIDEQLQVMIPKMKTEYRIENGFLNSRTFDFVPANAFGAHITASFCKRKLKDLMSILWQVTTQKKK